MFLMLGVASIPSKTGETIEHMAMLSCQATVSPSSGPRQKHYDMFSGEVEGC